MTLIDDVWALATPDGRMVGTPGHEQAKQYLLQRMAQTGLEPYARDSFALPYRRGTGALTNLVGQLTGLRPDLPPLLLGAHYDTAGRQPGADDNAAAIAILLSLAESLQNEKLERSVVFAFFDAEEPPYFRTTSMGSTVFYGQQRLQEVHCALILDLVGHDVPLLGFEDLLFITGMESDPGLALALQAQPEPPGVRVVAMLNRYVGDMSDHHVFRVNQRPYLFLSCGLWRHYHQPSDTPEKLNYQKIQAVADYLRELVVRVTQTRLDGPFEGYDSTPDELFFLRRTLWSLTVQAGIPLESRGDIDQVARFFSRRFGIP